MKKYGVIYSLGTDCACASYKNRFNLRICSGPFDWLTRASFETRVNLILNDFKNFLNIEDLIPLEKDPKVFNDEKCDYYENIRNCFHYYHDFLMGIPLEEQIDTIKEKYNRRIKRFYEKIAKEKRVLLIWLVRYQDMDDDVFRKLCDEIMKKFNKKIDFLIIEHDETKKDGELSQIELSENITRCRLKTISYDENGSPKPLGNEDNLSLIFSQYGLIYKLFTKQNLIKYLVKLICVFIPLKKWRKKVRDRWIEKKGCH